MVLTMAQTILNARGYRTLTAGSGEMALEIFAETPAMIDLVITDMVMPGMNGRELVERVKEVSPQTRILCSSGFAPAQLTSQDLAQLPKPFTAKQLLRKVREVLAD